MSRNAEVTKSSLPPCVLLKFQLSLSMQLPKNVDGESQNILILMLILSIHQY